MTLRFSDSLSALMLLSATGCAPRDSAKDVNSPPPADEDDLATVILTSKAKQMSGVQTVLNLLLLPALYRAFGEERRTAERVANEQV